VVVCRRYRIEALSRRLVVHCVCNSFDVGVVGALGELWGCVRSGDAPNDTSAGIRAITW
jgi:hypothetical protein